MLAICACVLAVWVAGMMTSFFANRALIQEIGIQATRARDIRLPLSEQLAALHTLQSQLERLQSPYSPRCAVVSAFWS